MSNSTIKPSFSTRIIPLLVLALLCSLYLLHHDLEVKSGYQIGPSICSLNQTFDCDAVANSEYSSFLGFPVAMFGSVFYSLLLMVVFFYRRGEDQVRLRSSIFFLSVLSLVPSIYLGYASYFILGKVCIFCSFLYVLNIFLAFFSFFYGRADGSLLERFFTGFKSFFSLALFGRGLRFPLAFLGVFVFFLFGHVAYVFEFLEPRYNALYDQRVMGELVSLWEKESPVDSLADVDSVPGVVILGSEKAPFTLVKFSDHECPMCQRMSPVVLDLYNEFQDKLRVVFLSFPLDHSCNPTMHGPLHLLACKLASLVACSAFESQERGLEIHEAIMAHGMFSEESFKNFLQDEGLDEATCLSQDRVNESIQSQIKLGVASDLTGTPSFFLNGRRLQYETLTQIKPLVTRIVQGEE